MSTNTEMESNLLKYLGLIAAGDLPAFRDEMPNLTCLNVSSPQVAHGRTPLHMAALKGKLENMAALKGKLEIAKLILDSPRASVQVVNAKDCFGYTPLHLAVRSGHVDLVRLLAESPLTTLDVATTSEKHLAVRSGHVDLVGLLAESPLTTLDVAATIEKDDEGKDCDGWTPLHLAAREGNVCILKILLQNISNGQGNKPINIHATNWQGESALDIAKQSKHDPKFVEILECFDANWLQLERQKSANSISGILVGATVVATVAFTTLMQPPTAFLPAQANSLAGSLLTTGGTAADQSAVHWFNQPGHAIGALIIATSLSFSVSVLSLIVGINGLIASTTTLKKEVHLLRNSVLWASQFLFTAISFLVWSAFVGTMQMFHVVVPHRHIVTKILAGVIILGMPIIVTFILIIIGRFKIHEKTGEQVIGE